jgi:hypothetical protein
MKVDRIRQRLDRRFKRGRLVGKGIRIGLESGFFVTVGRTLCRKEGRLEE